MTAHETNNDQQPQRHFFPKQEIQKEPRNEQTNEEILAWMSQEVAADKVMLDLLAEL